MHVYDVFPFFAAFFISIRILFKLLRENKELLEESKEFYQDIDVTPKASSKELTENELPKTENLLDTIKRVLEYWNTDIKPEIEKGKRVIIAAHGNSLRGLIKYLDNISDEDIIKLELQTGSPICYELDDNLKPITHYYLKENK